MSEEKFEIVRKMVEAANRRDLETLDAVTSKDFELHSVLAASEGRTFAGHRGLRDYFDWFDHAFGEFQNEIEELIEAGDRVVVMTTLTARGRTSGVSLAQHTGSVVSFRGEQISRWDSYFSPEEALEAAGLSD
jgi:ketosteroid isomerase-like protein